MCVTRHGVDDGLLEGGLRVLGVVHQVEAVGMLPGSNGLAVARGQRGAEFGSSVSVVSCRSMCAANCPRQGATRRISAADSGAGLGSRKDRLGSMASKFQRWMRS
jgi:hypothetical protein